MTAQAIVVSLFKGGTAKIRVTRETACGGVCGSCHGCGEAQKLIEATALNEIGACPGDRVTVESGTGRTLGLAALVYLLPVVLFLAGCLVKIWLGLLGALVAGLVVFWVNRRLRDAAPALRITGFAEADER